MNNINKLKYQIEDSTVAELLGVQNFTNKEAAILELVKNSFDASSTKLKIIFKDESIILEDNGKGMNEDDILKKWMCVGKSDKLNEYSFQDIAGNEKIYSGSKGIGRFALARLGGEIELISKKKNDNQVIWKTDWDDIFFDKNDEITQKCGTKIVIKKLRDRWNIKSVEKLKKYLSRTIKDSKMKITIEYDGFSMFVENFFSEPKLGINCLSIIKFRYSSLDCKLECLIKSDEFLETAKNYYKGDINNEKKIVNILQLFSKNNDDDHDIKMQLQELGNFSGELYFTISASPKDKERFLYKYIKITEKYDTGIILYRNSFSISSYDGSKDWIGLGKRARKSPAAATHPTGSWKVRENNLTGKIEIDKKENNYLKDLSNRQGLEENEHYELFIRILDKVLEIFENYRQSIIREINKKNVLSELEETEEVLKKILINLDIINNLNEFEKNKLKKEIISLQKREATYKKNWEEAEENIKYDTKILNMLSTIGLKASSIAHDLQNERNNIYTLSRDLKEALIKHNVWDILDREENKKLSSHNVPQMIEESEEINKKIVIFIGTLLEDTKKSKFKIKDLEVKKIMQKIKKNWERDYSILEIDLNIEDDIVYRNSEDILKVIFDNLILNSFQQNKIENKITINIQIKKEGEFLKVDYRDNGIGLHAKYLEDPMLILNVHETSRDDGHGLGMWIVNNTIIKTFGNVEEIGSIYNNAIKKGFYISFKLGSDI